MTKEREIIKVLNNLGVETRFISLYNNVIYINNIKFSKFSKIKIERFHEVYPDIDVVKSKQFQSIAIKTSRSLKNLIKPQETIYIKKGQRPQDILLEIILEPYQRKYGITITDKYSNSCKIADSKYLDEFAIEYIDLMIDAKKIQDKYEDNTIYPLMHVSRKMIYDWIKTTDLEYVDCTCSDTISEEVLEFLESHIPNVSESIKQSVTYIDENRID